jgi:acetylglutamate/LysW-gamma-L-alpha-aminoadipate kinase
MIIVKIGGGKEVNVEGAIQDLKDIKEDFIIVHGANHIRDKLFKDLGREKKVLTSLKGYSSV